jgi:hypothetical protein
MAVKPIEELSMIRSISQYQSKKQAVAEFDSIAWEVLKDGIYEYVCLYPEGEFIRTYEVKGGISKQATT